MRADRARAVCACRAKCLMPDSTSNNHPQLLVPAVLVVVDARNRLALPAVPSSNHPEDEGADHGTLSAAVAGGCAAADPGIDLGVRRPALKGTVCLFVDLPSDQDERRPDPTIGRRLGIMSTAPLTSDIDQGAARRSRFGTLLATNDLITCRNRALPLRLRPVKHFRGEMDGSRAVPSERRASAWKYSSSSSLTALRSDQFMG